MDDDELASHAVCRSRTDCEDEPHVVASAHTTPTDEVLFRGNYKECVTWLARFGRRHTRRGPH